MTTPGIFHRGLLAVTLLGLVFSLTVPCRAEPAGGGDFAALQADEGDDESLSRKVASFIRTKTDMRRSLLKRPRPCRWKDDRVSITNGPFRLLKLPLGPFPQMRLSVPAANNGPTHP